MNSTRKLNQLFYRIARLLLPRWSLSHLRKKNFFIRVCFLKKFFFLSNV